VLCLAPIELGSDAERRLYRVLSGLGPGTGVLGGLVVFVPVVDGARQRRQADAVGFLPEAVVVIRAVGMGRQAGELRPSSTGMWTVGGEILRLSGGGSSPAVQLRKAVELIHATLDSGGLDPGSPSALAAIDGPITSVRDRSAGGPVACSMDAGDVLTGLRHCANVGSQGDTRVWTTADVKAALTIFGLQARGPSVEELNNEGFLYSPYVLRRSESAVVAHADLAPTVSLLSGPFAAERAPTKTPQPVEPFWDEPARSEPPVTPAVAPRQRLTEPRPVAEQQRAVKPPEPAAAALDDSGVGGLFGEAVGRDADRQPEPPKSPRRPPPRVPERKRKSRPALLLGVAVLLVLAAVAGLLYALSSGLRGNDPAESDARAGGTSSSAPVQTTPGTSQSAPATQELSGSTYTLQAQRSDTDCASNAYGQVAEFFGTTPCTGLTRALFTTTVDDAPAVVSVSVVAMPDEASAADLQELADTSGTGNVSDLLRAGEQIDGGPSELVAAAYTSELSGSEVRIVEVAWVDGDTEGDESLLDAAAEDALLLEVPED